MKARKTLHFDANNNDLFFISDPHFYHKGIIHWMRTEFKTVEDMNEHIIKMWNSVVLNKNAIVFVLGDFCFGTKANHLYLMEQLNGTKYLIVGNHDNSVYGNWASINSIMDLNIKDIELLDKQQAVTLCHYPMLSWNKSHKGAWQLYGHVHGKLTNKDLADDDWTLEGKVSSRQLEVGADVWDYTPVSWNQVKEKLIKI